MGTSTSYKTMTSSTTTVTTMITKTATTKTTTQTTMKPPSAITTSMPSGGLILYKDLQPTRIIIFPIDTDIILLSGPKFLVVRDSGVVGTYNDLEDAKQALMSINSGNRLIAEVDSNGNLLRDPHIVGGQNQGKGMQAGFNKYWCGWDCINRLMDMCDIFLHPPKQVSNQIWSVR